jgi:hypothetical protein
LFEPVAGSGKTRRFMAMFNRLKEGRCRLSQMCHFRGGNLGITRGVSKFIDQFRQRSLCVGTKRRSFAQRSGKIV